MSILVIPYWNDNVAICQECENFIDRDKIDDISRCPYCNDTIDYVKHDDDIYPIFPAKYFGIDDSEYLDPRGSLI